MRRKPGRPRSMPFVRVRACCRRRRRSQRTTPGGLPPRGRTPPAIASSPLTLRGRVVLTDGKPIPPDIRVTLGADWGTDAQMTSLVTDGTFEFKGLARGVYSLAPALRSYKLADGATGEVLVDRDRKEVVLRMEPTPARP